MRSHFDLLIIGSGSGLTLIDDDINDWNIALIDAGTGVTNAFGGTCLNAGCIPTKMFAIPARYGHVSAEAARVNADVTFSGINYTGLKHRIFSRTDSISESGLAGTHARENVEVIAGHAVFVDPHTVDVDGRRLSADRIVIAAGSRPRTIDVPGFDEPFLDAFVHTSDSVMRMRHLPKRMVIVGGGIEAIEFSNIYASLGVNVTVVARGESLIRHHDPDVSRAITEAVDSRVALKLNQSPTNLEADPAGGVVLTAADPHSIEYSYATDMVLMCVGRVPNGDQLRVANAGVDTDDAGFIVVDDHLRTSQPHIWALGDVCAPQMLKHLANEQAKVVKHNLLAERDGGDLRVSDERFVPAGIFSSPEIATVGATETQLQEQGIDYVVGKRAFGDVAYGWALNDDTGFAKVLIGSDGMLLGAHIVGDQATTLIQPLITAMQFEIDAQRFVTGQYWIHPALAEVIENAVLDGLEKIDT